jgi:hypothetical protein
MDVTPSEFFELMAVMPAIWLNCFSSGVATEEAIICGLAPGRAAVTVIAERSTKGSEATGRRVNATMPARTRPTVRSVVATGLLMAGDEMFIAAPQYRIQAEPCCER